jgi:glycopeptide antibiotics resistance protein
MILWIAFTLFIVYGTTIPFHFTSDRAFVLDKLSHVTINPLISPDTGRRVSITDTVQNVLLFLPFGVFGVLAIGDRVRWAVTRIAIVTGLAALLSVSIETLQLFITDRTTSVSDAVTNTVGAFGGALVAHAAVHVGRRAIHRLRALGLSEVPSFYPMMIASIVLCLAAWEPFDVTLDVGSLIGKVHALRAHPWQFDILSDEGVEIVRYALFVLAGSSWLRQLGARRAAGVAALAGIGAAFMLEASQWVIASRMPGLEDAMVHAGGAVVGAALFQWAPRGRPPAFWFAILAAATWIGAALQMLTPFTVAAVHHPFNWMPFYNYYERTSFETISHTIELMLFYIPLGFWLPMVFRTRWQVYAVAFGASLAIAFPLEYMQGWIVGRYPDVTDVAVATLGALLGAWAGGAGWKRFLARAS